MIGMEIPLASDHYGHIGVNSGIKLARAMEKWNLAWMEDMVPWQYGELLKQIRESTTIAGADRRGHLPERGLHQADRHGRDRHDPSGSGERRRSDRDQKDRRLRDGARRRDGDALRRHADWFMANVHCAAATENFIALEHHSLDVPWWESLVQDAGGQPLVEKGFAIVPDTPGLGVELNEEMVKQHLRPDSGYFEPTPEWDKERSNDRHWS